MEVKQETVLDLLDTQSPALSSVSDMPVIETKPDSVAVPPEPAKAEEGEAEQQEESATSSTDEPDGQPVGDVKVPKGVGKRLAELTKRIDEAERREQQEREEKLRLLKLVEERGQTAQVEEQKVDDEPVPPSRRDFSDPDEYDAAMLSYTKENADWASRKAVERYAEQMRKDQEQRAIEESQRKTIESFQARIQRVKDKYPDFSEVVENSEVAVPAPVVHEIVHDEHGPDLQYYFAKHPEEAKRFMAMTTQGMDEHTGQWVMVPDAARQLLEMGKILAKMEAPSQPAKPVSAAPPPIRPSKPGTESMAVPDEELSMEAYAAKWKERNRVVRH